MPHKLNSGIAVIGIDIGKNSFHVVGHDKRGAIVLRQKWSRGQVETRLANLRPCLIGMEACVGAHHLCRKHGCTDQQCDVKISLANSEPSTHGTNVCSWEEKRSCRGHHRNDRFRPKQTSARGIQTALVYSASVPAQA